MSVQGWVGMHFLIFYLFRNITHTTHENAVSKETFKKIPLYNGVKIKFNDSRKGLDLATPKQNLIHL